MKKITLLLASTVLLFPSGQARGAQRAAPSQIETQKSGDNPIYRISINVVERSTKAINYRSRSGSTSIDFKGTALMPAARGEAKVESKQGYMEVEVEFDDLQGASRFGPEFLTYVMWAITPEGRATNMGEVILNGTKSKLNVTTELQSFGLIVTAEPYFAVAQPSDVVVMENIVRKDTVGKIEEIDAKYELLQRGQYTVNVLPAELTPMLMDKDTPLDLYQARNAVRIAKWAGADVSARESYAKATTLLAQAEAYKTRKQGEKPISMTSREAVQTAEDARLITLKSQADARLEQERAAAAAKVAAANADASAAEAGRVRAETLTATANRDAQSAAQRAAAEARAVDERNRRDAESAAQRAAAEARAAAERAAQDKQATETANQLARQAALDKAEREKQELRAKLSAQLNLILQTRDSARGLIVNMSDVLFDTGQFTLKPGAREKLAKISGIVQLYPTLKLEVEGHTDNVGTDALNMELSAKRAIAVRDFLVVQGISSPIDARGLGEGHPVVTNDTAAGRQQNRRVELIVSGEVIGTMASQ